jgi:hypothetical protein
VTGLQTGFAISVSGVCSRWCRGRDDYSTSARVNEDGETRTRLRTKGYGLPHNGRQLGHVGVQLGSALGTSELIAPAVGDSHPFPGSVGRDSAVGGAMQLRTPDDGIGPPHVHDVLEARYTVPGHRPPDGALLPPLKAMCAIERDDLVTELSADEPFRTVLGIHCARWYAADSRSWAVTASEPLCASTLRVAEVRVHGSLKQDPPGEPDVVGPVAV